MGSSSSGRRPRPTVVKMREGERESRINRDEPVPLADEVDPPQWLDADALSVWHRLAPDLVAKGVLTSWDVDAFAQFCALTVTNQAAMVDVLERGPVVDGGSDRGQVKNPAWQIARETTTLLVTLGARFGLNPSDRSRLDVGPAGGSPAASAGAERLLS